jgi:hypothetical protein
MKETNQLKRLQEAELAPSTDLWPQLEQRLARRPVAWRVWVGVSSALAVAACLLFFVFNGHIWQTETKSPVVAKTQTYSANKPRLTLAEKETTTYASMAQVSPETNDTPLANAPKSNAQPSPERLQKQIVPSPILANELGTTHRTETSQLASLLQQQIQANKRAAPAPSLVNRSHQDSTPLMAGNLVLNPNAISKDTVPDTRAFTPLRDSTQVYATALAPQRDSLPTANRQPKVRNKLLNRMNRALRWLPGGSAWPIIRFEKSEVALADNGQPQPEPAF